MTLQMILSLTLYEMEIKELREASGHWGAILMPFFRKMRKEIRYEKDVQRHD